MLKDIDLLKVQSIVLGDAALIVENGAQYLKKQVIDLCALSLFQ